MDRDEFADLLRAAGFDHPESLCRFSSPPPGTARLPHCRMAGCKRAYHIKVEEKGQGTICLPGKLPTPFLIDRAGAF